ncbi:MAG: hypothetical protein LBK95_09165 [Bifidobacteriaceae bacterium]|jgi:hypothetical protein|nr:hypothetical protein [Bifidobacteriaceae bacterium]
MTTSQPNYARAYLAKAREYLASAEVNFGADRFTVAAGDAIHAGICAKDAIVMRLTGKVSKTKNHGAAVTELKNALGKRDVTPGAERALRELIAQKGSVEYGAEAATPATTKQLVRRARTLVDIAAALLSTTGE